MDLRIQTETYRWKTTVAKSDFQENHITLQDRRKGSLGSKQEGPEMRQEKADLESSKERGLKRMW